MDSSSSIEEQAVACEISTHANTSPDGRLGVWFSARLCGSAHRIENNAATALDLCGRIEDDIAVSARHQGAHVLTPMTKFVGVLRHSPDWCGSPDSRRFEAQEGNVRGNPRGISAQGFTMSIIGKAIDAVIPQKAKMPGVKLAKKRRPPPVRVIGCP
jgi:hypothetical protein